MDGLILRFLLLRLEFDTHLLDLILNLLLLRDHLNVVLLIKKLLLPDPLFLVLLLPLKFIYDL